MNDIYEEESKSIEARSPDPSYEAYQSPLPGTDGNIYVSLEQSPDTKQQQL